MTQSFIVYRNPLEQMFWESGMIFPIFASMVVFVVSIVIMAHICDMTLGRKFKYLKYTNYFIFIPSTLVWVVTLYFLV